MSERDDDSANAPEFELPIEPPPLLTTLEHVATEIDPARLDEIWIFPPRRAAGVETAVIVLAVREATPAPDPAPLPSSPGPARRRILTIHYTASRDRRGRLQVQHSSNEHGSAVPGRMGPVIEGVLRRMDESMPPHPPRHERLDGDPVRWLTLLESIRYAPPRMVGDRG